MPAVNPRVSVTLKPSLDAVLRRLSDATGQSRSSLIAELLEQSEPVFERMAVIIETAKTATEEAKERMRANLDEAHSRLVVQAGIVGDLFEEQVADLVDDVEQVGRRRAGRARSGDERKDEHGTGPRSHLGKAMAAFAQDDETPPVTRGSGTHVPTPKKPVKTASKPAAARVSGRKRGA